MRHSHSRKRTGTTFAGALSIAALAMPGNAAGALGLFEHGAGIASMGFGGISYSVASETTAMGANPAHVVSFGHRFDAGVSFGTPKADGVIRDNAAAADSQHDTGSSFIYIPQGGWARPVGERWHVGIALQNAGLGPSYDSNPYARFGGGPEAELQLGQSTLVNVLGFRLNAAHAFAASLNVSYQTFKVLGLEGFDNDNASVAPGFVTNRRTDGSWGVGFSLGWTGQLNDRLRAGAGYRSKTWTEKHRDYRGLLPDGGRLELPAIYGLGLAFDASEDWTVALDYQRFAYGSEPAMGNRLAQLTEQGQRLGAADGPGFGFRDHNVFKLGVSWRYDPALTLRAGLIRANNMVPPSETLFSFFGAIMNRMHYTAGATYDLQGWELSGYYAFAPETRVHGDGSIPQDFGGGEADVSFKVHHFGLSVGRRFGSP